MENKIRVNEYVRTSEGYIGKYKKNGLVKHTCEIEDNEMSWITGKYNIVKHSKDIIDLIQEDDLIEINNKKYEVIFDKSYEKLGLLIPNREHLAIRHCSLEYIFSNEGMKEFENISIITKEQIKQIEYVIKE